MRVNRVAVIALLAAAGGTMVAVASPGAAAAGKISVTFLPAPPGPIGGVAVIPIRVTNGLSRALAGVSLVVTGPAWVRLSGPRCVYGPGRLRCALGKLAAGKGVTIRIRAKPKRSLDYRLIARASVPTTPTPTPSP
jgi:hypothetical protein